MLGENSLLRGWWGSGTGCPEKLWMPHPLRCWRPCWMGPWAASSAEWQPFPQQGHGTKWSLRFLPSQAILWFYYFWVFSKYFCMTKLYLDDSSGSYSLKPFSYLRVQHIHTLTQVKLFKQLQTFHALLTFIQIWCHCTQICLLKKHV